MDDKVKEGLDSLISPLSIADQKRLVRTLIYGDYGHGKTTLAGLIAQVIINQHGGKHCIVTTDSNWVVLNKFPELAENTLRMPFDGFSMINNIVKAKKEGIEPYKDITVLTIDTISTACDTVLLNLVDKKVFKNKDGSYPIKPEWDHYRYLAMLTRKMLTELNSSDLNILYLTHLREPNESDLSKGKRNIRSNIPEKTFEAIAQEVQAIGWLYREKIDRKQQGEVRIQFEPTQTETAKSQIPTVEQKTYLVEEIPPLIEKWIAS